MDRNSSLTVGIDLGAEWSYACVLDADANVVERFRLRTSEDAFLDRFMGRARMRIALEAGRSSLVLSRALERCGHEVYVANPRALASIYHAVNKNDRNDAERLARLAKADPLLLSPVQHRSEQEQCDLAVIKSREALVKARTAQVNAVHGICEVNGVKLPSTSTAALPNKVAPEIPKKLQPAVFPLLAVIQELTRQIRELDRTIERISAERYPVTEILRQVPGVGPITALTFVLVVQDPRRFGRRDRLAAYLGLQPRQDQSGEHNPELGISKAGNGLLRKYLTQCAQYILGPRGIDSDLRRAGERIAGNRGKVAKRKAIVAVARKLGLLLRQLWITGEVYEPLRNAKRSTVIA